MRINSTPRTSGVNKPSAQGDNKADKFLKMAMKFMGQPYKWGGGHGGTMKGAGPVDCSGLVQQAARMAGLNFDGTAAMQQGKGKAVSMKNLKPGDLVFRGAPAHHVGIYVGNGKVLHAPKTGDKVRLVDASFFQSARRVFSNPGEAIGAAGKKLKAAVAGDSDGTTRTRSTSRLSLN